MAGDLDARKPAVSYHPEPHRERIDRNLEFAPEPLLPHHLADQQSHVLLRHLHSALDGRRAWGLGWTFGLFGLDTGILPALRSAGQYSLDTIIVDDLSCSKRGQGAKAVCDSWCTSCLSIPILGLRLGLHEPLRVWHQRIQTKNYGRGVLGCGNVRGARA